MKILRYVLLGLFLVLVFSSKYSDYRQRVKFHNENISKKIVRIKEGRGTKVYFDDENYFFLDSYKGPPLAIGDFVIKDGTKISVFRGSDNSSFSGILVPPPETYFEFFFF